jgi:hypothetical protein
MNKNREENIKMLSKEEFLQKRINWIPWENLRRLWLVNINPLYSNNNNYYFYLILKSKVKS